MTLRSIHALLRTMIVMGLPCVALAGAAAATGKRVLELEDFDRMVSVEDPVCSQDGRWIAYTWMVRIWRRTSADRYLG